MQQITRISSPLFFLLHSSHFISMFVPSPLPEASHLRSFPNPSWCSNGPVKIDYKDEPASTHHASLATITLAARISSDGFQDGHTDVPDAAWSCVIQSVRLRPAHAYRTSSTTVSHYTNMSYRESGPSSGQVVQRRRSTALEQVAF